MKCLLLLTLGLLSSSFAHNIQILKAFMTGYNEFCADIYNELPKYKTGNFIMCPLSADLNFAFASRGARAHTAAEFKAALRLPDNSEDTHAIFKFIASRLQSTQDYTLSSINKMYVMDGFQINDNFTKLSVDVFDSEIQNVNFANSDETATKINRWVESKTHDKIKNLIRPDFLDSLTRIVLVNALYFHGKWIKGFDTEYTSEFPFFTKRNDFVSTDMMAATDRYEYYESSELKAKFLKLDYKGDDVSMHIVLPNEIDGLSALETKISDALIPPRYNYENLSIIIPKFKIETQIDFKPILKAMGVRSAFEDNADFGGIGANQEQLFITKIIQKTFIEVEEKGTTAASASGSISGDRSFSSRGKQKEFHANHPFLFYLRLNKLRMNFFIGRFKSP